MFLANSIVNTKTQNLERTGGSPARSVNQHVNGATSSRHRPICFCLWSSHTHSHHDRRWPDSKSRLHNAGYEITTEVIFFGLCILCAKYTA